MTLRLALANWRRRPEAFRELREYVGPDGERLVVMSYAPVVDDAEAWERLRDLWLDFPVHPHLLDAIERDGDALLLRYAPLDWHHVALSTDLAEEDVASIAFEIVSAFQGLARHVSQADLGWLSRPRAMFDAEGALRLGFVPAGIDQLPDDIRASWPVCDDRALVFIVGRTIEPIGKLVGGWSRFRHLNEIVRRATKLQPSKRHDSLAALSDALVAIGAAPSARRALWHVSNVVEAGLGEVALRLEGIIDVSTRRLHYRGTTKEIQLHLDVGDWFVVSGADDVRDALLAPLQPPSDLRAVADKPTTPVTTIASRISALEAERRFAEALSLYDRLTKKELDATMLAMRARCHLELGEAGHAVEFARRALTKDRNHPLAALVAVKALLVSEQRDEALAIADRWATNAPIDALAHYSRGRCLFALARHAEAITSFDRATALQPGLMVAHMLRLESARGLARLKQTVGSGTRASPIPRHLAEPSNLLAVGRAGEALAILEPLADDLEAQLLLGACLAAERRLDEAIAVYDRIASPPNMSALVGAGFALLELDRADEALVRFDRAVALAPEDFAVLEGRARALERLGRGDEANQLRDHRRSMR